MKLCVDIWCWLEGRFMIQRNDVNDLNDVLNQSTFTIHIHIVHKGRRREGGKCLEEKFLKWIRHIHRQTNRSRLTHTLKFPNNLILNSHSPVFPSLPSWVYTHTFVLDTGWIPIKSFQSPILISTNGLSTTWYSTQLPSSPNPPNNFNPPFLSLFPPHFKSELTVIMIIIIYGIAFRLVNLPMLKA